MNSDITTTFTTEEFVLLKQALERFHFFGGKQIRDQTSNLIQKLNALLPSPGVSY